MQKNELSVIESADISRWDFEGLRKALAGVLAEYDTHVYTDEASAKADRIELNRIKKAFDDKRKEYKKICLEPYNIVDGQVKELVKMIDSQQLKIAEAAGNFEQNRKEEKRYDLKKYYDSKAAVLGKYADKIYDKISDPRWFNATTSVKKYQEEILNGIEKAKDEMAKLRKLKSPYVETLIEDYVSGTTFEECVKKNEDILAANSRAGISGQSPAAVKKAAVDNSITECIDKGGEVVIKLRGLKKKPDQRSFQLNVISDFLSALGIDFEMINTDCEEKSTDEG